MPRGIPWDDLTLFREKKIVIEQTVEALNAEAEPRDFNKDAYNIGKRALFGLVVRSDIVMSLEISERKDVRAAFDSMTCYTHVIPFQ